MLLSVNCKTCDEKLENSYPVNDRIGLAQHLGDSIPLTCTECGANQNYHPDEFKAINNVPLRLKLFAIAMSVTVVGCSWA